MQNIKPNLKLDWCSFEAAKYACEHWHYSKKIPVNKLVKIGIWENDIFIGAIIFGLGASAVLHKQFKLEQTEVCELVRVALNTHYYPVSKMISIAINKFLKVRCPKIKIIVSFADTNENHYGGIYQASNWYYTGLSAKTTEYFYNNNWRHVTDIYKRLDRCLIKKLQKRIKPSKHRYIYILDKNCFNTIEKRIMNYPKKCGDSLINRTLDYQSKDRGVSPTSPLHRIIKI